MMRIAAIAALLALPVAAEDAPITTPPCDADVCVGAVVRDWVCLGGADACFDQHNIILGDTPGQMLILAKDPTTKETGWIAVDCAARMAAVPNFITPIADGSALDAACETFGEDE